MKKKITLSLFVIALVFAAKAQNFNYTVFVQQSNFNPISDSVATPIDSTVWDDNTYFIPIGFTFNFAGQAFDSLKVRTNGTFSFDNNNKFNFVSLYKNFFSDVDENGVSISPILKELTVRQNGTKILKIEFKNVSFKLSSDGTKKHTNFQVWFVEENNSIEFHMGDSEAGSTIGSCLLGLLSMNPFNETSIGYLLQGDFATAQGVLIENGSPLAQLTSLPAAGLTYVFTMN